MSYMHVLLFCNRNMNVISASTPHFYLPAVIKYLEFIPTTSNKGSIQIQMLKLIMQISVLSQHSEFAPVFQILTLETHIK